MTGEDSLSARDPVSLRIVKTDCISYSRLWYSSTNFTD